MKNLFYELKRRNVIRAAAAYAVVAWFAVQGADITFPHFGIPDWVLTMVIVLAALGFPLTLCISWFYELTPKGFRKQSGAKQAQAQSEAQFNRLIDFVVIALLVIAAGWLIFVITRETEESKQKQASAEKMVEFMIGQLQEPLNSAGNLQALDSVGREILDYYASLDPGEMNEDSLSRRSRALLMVGRIEELRGNLAKAEQFFQAAFETTGELLARSPNNTARIFDHAQSSFYIGLVDYRRGKLVEAEQHFVEYRNLANRLVELESGNLDWHREVGYTNSSLGTLYLNQGLYGKAIEAFTTFLTVQEKLVSFSENKASSSIDLAQAHAWLADSNMNVGNFEAARSHRLAELSIYQDILSTDPENLNIVSKLIRNHQGLAQIYLDHGEVEAAEGVIEVVLPQAERILKSGAENTRWVERIISLNLDYGEVLLHLQRPGEAEARLLFVREHSQGLVALDSTVVNWKGNLYDGSLLAYAHLLKENGRYEEALQNAAAAIADLENLNKDNPRNPALFTLLCSGYFLSGEIQHLLSHPEEAERSWEQALTLLMAETAGMGVKNKELLAKTYLRLGETEKAREIARYLQQIGYKHPDFVDFWERNGDLSSKSDGATQPEQEGYHAKR